MTDSLIIQKAIEEIETKTFGLTEQFLKIHEVIYENDTPKAIRADTKALKIMVEYYEQKSKENGN